MSEYRPTKHPGIITIAPRRDTLAHWQDANPVINDRHIAVIEDESTFVVGDGKSRFSELKQRPLDEFLHAWLCEGNFIGSFF